MLAMNPYLSEARYHRGIASVSLGELEAARQAATAIERGPEAETFALKHHLRGSIHEREGNFQGGGGVSPVFERPTRRFCGGRAASAPCDVGGEGENIQGAGCPSLVNVWKDMISRCQIAIGPEYWFVGLQCFEGPAHSRPNVVPGPCRQSGRARSASSGGIPALAGLLEEDWRKVEVMLAEQSSLQPDSAAAASGSWLCSL